MSAAGDMAAETPRLEKALRYLSANPGTKVQAVADKFKVSKKTLWDWLGQFNRGRPRLAAHIIDGVLAGLTPAALKKAGAKDLGDGRNVRRAVNNLAGKREAAAEPATPPPNLGMPGPGPDLLSWLKAQGIADPAQVVSYLVRVSPALAKAWMAHNRGNRRPSSVKILRFSDQMRADKWEKNGETIKFSSTGRLLDGQSRLEAVVRSGCTVWLEVRGDLPDRAQESMDTGEARRNSHQLEMLGEANPNETAAALRLVFTWDKGALAGTGDTSARVRRLLTNTAIRETLEKHPNVRASVGFCLPVKQIMAISLAAAMHYIFTLASKPKADAFMKGLMSGANLAENDAVYMLRQRLLDDRLSTAKLTARARLGLLVKAWNAFFAGRKLERLSFFTEESIPEIAGVPRAQEREA